MKRAAIVAAAAALVAAGVTAGLVLSRGSSTGGFHITAPKRYAKTVAGPLHRAGANVFVTNVASWVQLPTVEKRTVVKQITNEAKQLRRKPVSRPASGQITTLSASSPAASHHAVLVTAASGPQPSQYPPFDGLQPQPQAAEVSGPGLISVLPCVRYGYTQSGVPLIACGGAVYDLSSGDPVNGIEKSAVLAEGMFANGWAFDPLTSTYQGLAQLPSGTSQPVNARFSVTTISLNIGFGLGTCGETDATLVAVNSSAQEYTADYTPSQQVSLSNCLSTFQVFAPLPAVTTVTSLISVLQSAWGEAKSLDSGGWSSECDALSKGLNFGGYANSIFQAVLNTTSKLPSLGLSADCATTPLSWVSPGEVAAGSPVGIDVGSMAMAKAIGAFDLGIAYTKVSGCVWAGAVDYTTCSSSGPSPPPTATPSASPSAPTPTVISQDTTLSSDIHCSDLTIEPGATLTTNGHNIYCSGTVDNKGTIITGSSALQDFPLSYGGSGGGSTNLGGPAAPGFSSRSPGGAPCNTSGCTAANGSSPNFPALSSALIASWYQSGMNQYLTGAGGGSSPLVHGGAGANGLLIEARNIIAGNINSAGQDGQNQPAQSSAGGGGGGVVILAYVSNLTPGHYTFSGGYTITADGTHHEFGGSGAVIAHQFASLPIPP